LKLTNQDIWAGYKGLVKLVVLDLPQKTSIDLYAIIFVLERPYQAIEFFRAKLCEEYGEKDEKMGLNIVNQDNLEKSAIFYTRLSDLFIQEWNGEFDFEPVEIDKKTAVDNMDTLAPLWGKFVRNGS